MTIRATLSSTVMGLALAGALPAVAAAENVVTMVTGQIFRSIDPAKITDYTDYMGAVNLYAGLTTVDPKGTILPALAESWEVADGGLTITYTLRADAKFSDGSPVEASDVVYTVERLLRLNQGPASMLARVLKPGAVTALDARRVSFALTETYSPFLSVVPAIFILNAEVVEANKGDDDAQTWLSSHAAGAGGFTLESFDRGSSMTVVRNPHHHVTPPANAIDRVRWVVLQDEASVRAFAASGEMTLSGPFNSPDTYRALSEMGPYVLQKDPSTSSLYLKLNHQVAPTDDPHIRRAIALATDYDTIREVIFPGLPMTSPLPGAFADYLASDLPDQRYDLEAAKAEVAQSRYAGQKIPITMGHIAGSKYQEEISLLMQANLEQLGFVVTQEGNPWNRITELAAAPETTPALNQIFYSATYPSPDSIFFGQYHSASRGTWASTTWLQDPEVDGLIDAARATTDIPTQIQLYGDLQRRLMEMQSDVYLLTQVSTHAIHKCLKGLTVVPMRSFGYDFSRFSWQCD